MSTDTITDDAGAPAQESIQLRPGAPAREPLRAGMVRCGCLFTIALRPDDDFFQAVSVMESHVENNCPNRTVEPPRPPESTPVAMTRAVFENVFSGGTALIILAAGLAWASIKYGLPF